LEKVVSEKSLVEADDDDDDDDDDEEEEEEENREESVVVVGTTNEPTNEPLRRTQTATARGTAARVKLGNFMVKDEKKHTQHNCLWAISSSLRRQKSVKPNRETRPLLLKNINITIRISGSQSSVFGNSPTLCSYTRYVVTHNRHSIGRHCSDQR
jgi:hypothetical protein